LPRGTAQRGVYTRATLAASERLSVAVVQLNSQGEVAANLAAARELVVAAAARGAKLVVLPENFAYFGPDEGRLRIAEKLGDQSLPMQAALAEMARESKVTLVAGGMAEASDDPQRPYNTCAVFDQTGKLAASYRKIHLFDVDLPDGTRLKESDTTKPGTEPVVVEVDGFKLGLSVCYDLRFPELYRALVDRGAEVLLVPAAFTLLTGKEHWHVLLRARAVESQTWVVAAGQWGKHPKGRASFGHSLIADPWGTVVAECADRVGFAIADLERADLDRVRASLPSLRHRRL
jgi:deaminated glutathione amidase